MGSLREVVSYTVPYKAKLEALSRNNIGATAYVADEAKTYTWTGVEWKII